MYRYSILQRATNSIVQDVTATTYFEELARRIRTLITDLKKSLPRTVVEKLNNTVTYLQSSESKRLKPQEKKYITRK